MINTFLEHDCSLSQPDLIIPVKRMHPSESLYESLTTIPEIIAMTATTDRLESEVHLYATAALVGPASGMISVFLNPAASAQRLKSEGI